MKVRDLIAGSTFAPGSGRDSVVAPRVTVILPTYRRGDSGMLQRAIDSVLAQSFSALELIIVDDASTDSTADIIAETMDRDPRVSLIRHPNNVGLPAISEYEAYVLARGELIAFAFDDTVFYRHALRDLVRESDEHPQSLITGYVTAFFRSPVDGELLSHTLGVGVDDSDLLTRNVIPNNGVLAPKALLEEVGLFDPHISLARLCDYDLWLRVRRRFPIRFLDVCVGEEHGPTTTDSLGVTYPLDQWASDDRMRQSRDGLLTPARFADLEVFDSSAFESARTRRSIATLVEKHLESHAWMTPPIAAEPPAGRVPRVLVLARGLDAAIHGAFDGARAVPNIHVRIVDPSGRAVSEVADADVLIVTRNLREDRHWIDAARAVGSLVYYFLDDDRPVDQLRDDVRPLDGVFAATEALATAAREEGLHPIVTALSPADTAQRLRATIEPALPKHEPDDRIRLRSMTEWLSSQLAKAGGSGVGSNSASLEGAGALVRQVRKTSLRSRLELSPPLTVVPYLSYLMRIPTGSYRTIEMTVWGDGDAGDEIGVEIVDPAGRILLHKLAALPRNDDAVTVSFDARQLRITSPAQHEVRIFAHTNRLAFVVERLDRGRFGLGRQRMTPVVTFER